MAILFLEEIAKSYNVVCFLKSLTRLKMIKLKPTVYRSSEGAKNFLISECHLPPSNQQ